MKPFDQNSAQDPDPRKGGTDAHPRFHGLSSCVPIIMTRKVRGRKPGSAKEAKLRTR